MALLAYTVAMRKKQDHVTTQVRLPQDLHTRLAEAADEDRRSMNSEIQELLDLGLQVRARLRKRREQLLDAIADELR